MLEVWAPVWFSWLMIFRNALDMLMKEAGRLMWPDTYELCTECGKPRGLYSSRKFQWKDKRDLEDEIGDLLHMLGMDLHNCIPGDLSSEAVSGHLFN